MKIILGIDASTEKCSVALSFQSKVHLRFSSQVRAHAEVLLPMVEALLSENGLALNDLDAIVCSAGPGSFTGLRIAFGVAQGLAFGANLPLLMLDSLSVLGKTAVQSQKFPENAYYLCVLDARMGELYWSVCDTSGNVVQPTQLNSPEEVLQAVIALQNNEYPIVVVGSGADILGESVHLQRRDVDVYPQADALIALAEKRVIDGDCPSADDATLNYLRNSVTWNKRKRIREAN